MKERRTVTLTVRKEVEVDIDDDQYETEPVWDGENYSVDYHIDEQIVEDAIREALPNDIDGWEVEDVTDISR